MDSKVIFNLYKHLVIYYIFLITKTFLKYLFAVVKCVPMLKDLDKLEAHLAKTNDFPGFVVQLRTMFINEFTCLTN